LKTLCQFINRKTLRNNIILIMILGLAAYLLIPQITILESSIRVLLNLALCAVALAILAVILSNLSSGFLMQNILAITHESISIIRSTLIYLGSYSVGLVAGGTIGTSVAIVRWTRLEKGVVGSAALVGALHAFFINLVLVFVSVFGLIHLLIVHTLTSAQKIGFSIFLFLLVLAICTALLSSHYRKQASAVISWIIDRIRRWRHVPIDQNFAPVEVADIFREWDILWKGKWYFMTAGAFLFVALDVLTLYSLFMAAGKFISIGVLLSGYALPLLLGRIAFIFPGGAGIVDSSMVALYISLGIPSSTTVVAVLGYRFLSFWLPGLLGLPIAVFLDKNWFKSHAPKNDSGEEN